MKSKLTLVVWASTGYQGSMRKEEVEVDAEEYAKAEDKEAFLEDLYNAVIPDLVESGYYLEDESEGS